MSTQAYDIVKLARSNKRPTGLDYIQNLCGDFLELHGDRCYADDAAIVGGVGHFRGIPVTFVAIEKGHSAKERMSRFFGAPTLRGIERPFVSCARRRSFTARFSALWIPPGPTAALAPRSGARGRPLRRTSWA